jgi:hypothetical protein
MTSRKAAYVTLLTKQSYLPGVLVLGYGLRSVRSKYALVAMVTPSLSTDARNILQKQGIILREVESLKPDDGRYDLNPYDSRFEDTWTKLR